MEHNNQQERADDGARLAIAGDDRGERENCSNESLNRHFSLQRLIWKENGICAGESPNKDYSLHRRISVWVVS